MVSGRRNGEGGVVVAVTVVAGLIAAGAVDLFGICSLPVALGAPFAFIVVGRGAIAFLFPTSRTLVVSVVVDCFARLAAYLAYLSRRSDSLLSRSNSLLHWSSNNILGTFDL